MTAGLYLQFTYNNGAFNALTFADGTTASAGNYRVTDFRLGVAEWTGEDFALTTDRVTFDVFGTTAANLWENVTAVENMVRWVDSSYKNQTWLNAVRVRYSPVGAASTTADPNTAVVWPEARLTLPSDDYPRTTSGGFLMSGLTLEYQRKAWAAPTASAITASSASTQNGLFAGIAVGAFSAAAVSYSVSNCGAGVSPNGGTAYYLLGNKAAQSGMSAGIATGWTSVNDAANNAVNTNVLRYTPTGTAESTSGSFTAFPVSFTETALWAIYFSARNNSATTSFAVRFQSIVSGLAFQRVYTKYTVIPAGATQPRYYFGGHLSGEIGAGDVSVLATASAASGTLDFDNFTAIRLNTANSFVYGGFGVGASAPTLASFGFSSSVGKSFSPEIRSGFSVLGNVGGHLSGVGASTTFFSAYLKCTGNSWRELVSGAVTSNAHTLTLHPMTQYGV